MYRRVLFLCKYQNFSTVLTVKVLNSSSHFNELIAIKEVSTG